MLLKLSKISLIYQIRILKHVYERVDLCTVGSSNSPGEFAVRTFVRKFLDLRDVRSEQVLKEALSDVGDSVPQNPASSTHKRSDVAML